MTANRAQLLRWTGLLCGLALAAGLLLAGRVPAEGGTGGAHVSLATAPVAQLALAPLGRRFLDARAVRPGRPGTGAVTVRNLHATPLAVSVRARAADGDLDTALRVELRVAGALRFRGTSGALRRWSGTFPLAPRATVRAAFRVLVPEGHPSHTYAGRVEHVVLTWRARRAAS